MSINCTVTLRWDSTSAQQRALGVALWQWCNGASGNTGMYPYLDNAIGALAGGVLFRLPGGSEAGFWGSLALDLLGAYILLARVRVLALGW